MENNPTFSDGGLRLGGANLIPAASLLGINQQTAWWRPAELDTLHPLAASRIFFFIKVMTDSVTNSNTQRKWV